MIMGFFFTSFCESHTMFIGSYIWKYPFVSVIDPTRLTNEPFKDCRMQVASRFYIYVHQGRWPEFSFPYCGFDFGVRLMPALSNEFGSFPSASVH